MKPKVSVIIPIYNSEKYLEKCLKSLQNQTLKEIEIICINDGSNDSSLDIIKKFTVNDKRFLVLDEKNYGQSHARNQGLKVASGDYIGFLDADDWAENNMFEALYNTATKLDSDIVMSSIITHDYINNRVTCEDPYLSLKCFDESFDNRNFYWNDCKDFLFRICVTPWNKLIRRNKLVFFPENINFEDNVFTLNLLLTCSISLNRTPLVNYRRGSDTSYTFSNQDYKKLDFFKIIDLERKLLKEKKVYEEIKEYFEKSSQNTLKYWYKKLSNPITKLKYRIKYFTKYPFKTIL